MKQKILLEQYKSLEDSGLLLKVKEQKGGFHSALLGTLGASLLGDLLIDNIKGKGVLRAGYGNNNKMDFLYCLIL